MVLGTKWLKRILSRGSGMRQLHKKGCSSEHPIKTISLDVRRHGSAIHYFFFFLAAFLAAFFFVAIMGILLEI